MKTLAKTQVPCLIGIVGSGLLGLLLSFAISAIPEQYFFLSIAPTMFWILTLLSAAVVTVVAYVFILIHYYRKFFTDEGYLTFMFPASIETQFLSKVLSGVVYWFLAGAALILALVLALVLPVSSVLSFSSEIAAVFGVTVETSASASFIPTLLSVFTILVTPFSSIILYFTAITLGSIFFVKHKILGSILFYVLSNIIVNTITTVVQFVTLIPANLATNPTLSTSIVLLSNIIMLILVAIIGYLISTILLRKKLNLE